MSGAECDTSNVLSVSGLSVTRHAGLGRATGDAVYVLSDVGLTLAPGEILGVVGVSGAGKSVLCRAIVDCVPEPGRIAAGVVDVLGRRVVGDGEGAADDIRGSVVGVIVDDAKRHLNPLVRVGVQVSNVLRAHVEVGKSEAKAQVLQAFRDVGLPDPELRYKSYPHEFSGGMAQRALIAMALICNPSLVIADEPTSGLDVTIQDQILRMLRERVADTADRERACLLVSRDMGIIATFCDRVAVLHEGRIVEEAKLPAFFDVARHPISRELIAAASYSPAPQDRRRATGLSRTTVKDASEVT